MTKIISMQNIISPKFNIMSLFIFPFFSCNCKKQGNSQIAPVIKWKKYLGGIFLFCFYNLISFGQEQDLIKYLEAYKTSEFGESQKIISDFSFGQKAEYSIAEYSKFAGLLFNTDIPGIKGYKAIGLCKVENEASGFVEKKMMAVMYFDKTKKHWSVFSLREAVDPMNKYETSKDSAEAGNFNIMGIEHIEYIKYAYYKIFSYWSLMSGHIKDAKKYLDLAFEAAKKSTPSIPIVLLDQMQIEDTAIKSIM